MIPKQYKDIQIQSYKHDESLHRIWEKATVLYADEEVVIVANKRTKVIESNGRFWHTREPSVSWFYKKHWFNIIGIIKRNSIHYYCNIASPYVCDTEGLKYIDYDLDIKVIEDFSYNVLDRNEYNKHKNKMDYPTDLKVILEKELNRLKEMIENREEPFQHDLVYEWYSKYEEHKNGQK
jgi:protein associated with RNAse G/E